MKKILLAGATGYLGSFILKELLKLQYQTTVIIRNPSKIKETPDSNFNMIKAEITKPDSLIGCCNDIDIVISTVGITHQKDGLTYMDVDFQGNMNLLSEAKKSGVRKFIYVSVLNGDKLRYLKICNAKEKFVDELKNSGLEYCIIRPNGFFSDITEFYNMAKKGKIYLFGDGDLMINPIHGEDLAKICTDAIQSIGKEIEAGGPEILTQTDIARLAFEATGKTPNITYLPDWIRKLLLKTAKLILDSKKFGPVEFFLSVMSLEMVAPQYGKHTIKAYFNELKQHDANYS